MSHIPQSMKDARPDINWEKFEKHEARKLRSWARSFSSARAHDKAEQISGLCVHDIYPERAGWHAAEKAQPAWYFFYGRLMDPECLAQVAGLDDVPAEMFPAIVESATLKYWGQVPVLDSGEATARVDGLLWYAPSTRAAERIREYSKEAFMAGPIWATRTDNGKLIRAVTLYWNYMPSLLDNLPDKPSASALVSGVDL